MGNNNLDENQQTTGQQTTENQQGQQTQQTPPSQQSQETTNDSTEPTLAQLMKEVAELKVDNKRFKKANDALASENASLKKQVNAKLTEEELRAQQKSEKDEEIANELKELRKENALNKATKRYMSMNMNEELAEKVAQMELDGDMDSVANAIKAFQEAREKEVAEKVTADLYAKMPTPMSGNGDGQIDYEKQYNDKLANGDVRGAIEAQISGMFQAAQ